MSAHIAERAASLLGARVVASRAVAGGDINDAYALTLDDGRRVFVKTRADAPSDMFVREAEGLAWLREAGAIAVPEVLAVSHDLLALPWIEPAPRAHDFDAQLGRGLAALHRFGSDRFGLAHDNYIGSLPQANAPLARFADFYRERRLAPLVAHASTKGLLDAAARKAFDTLYTKLDALIPDEPPARLHGDLWSGNVHTDERGKPVLIDPAVYGGHREIDLAMLALFGAPSARFFAAYDEVYPRAPGHAERVSLFQLYPLLVHVCLFGAGYVAQLMRAVREYR